MNVREHKDTIELVAENTRETKYSANFSKDIMENRVLAMTPAHAEEKADTKVMG